MIASSRAAVLRPTTLDPTVWPAALAALRDLGFDAVDVPLVWREHDREGEVDLSAPRDLARFFDLVAAEGFRAIVRLGPTCAEDAPAMGIPDRLLRDPAVCARTRRGNPQVTLDGLRVMPLPSFGSARWREACARWVRAAATLLAPYAARGGVTAVVLGPAALLTLRDAPDDRDHHPDLPAEGEDPATTLRAYLDHLAGAARAAGLPHAALVTPRAPCPREPPHPDARRGARGDDPRAVAARGVEGLWRVARLATTLPHGALLELHAGGAPFAAPVRATHALQAARVALAAGPRAITVAAGCVGHRWPGALLDEKGRPRAHAAHWARALAAAAAWPAARPASERAEVVRVDAAVVRGWWSAPSLGELPRTATLTSLAHPALAGGDDEALRREQALQREARPFTVAGDPAWCAPPEGEWVRGVTPQGAALLRAVQTDGGRCLLAVSASEETASVQVSGRWRDEQGALVEAVEVAEGEVRVLRAEGEG
ncbi:MAG: beta-galactosidase [Polyangiales bacterium]